MTVGLNKFIVTLQFIFTTTSVHQHKPPTWSSVFKDESYGSLRTKIDQVIDLIYPNEPAKIVGGHNTKKGQFQHQAAIVIQKPGGEYEIQCGGSLISPQWVLTAAHCKPDDLSKELVLLGAHDLRNRTKDEQKFMMKEFIPHEKYDDPFNIPDGESGPEYVFHDIALVLLDGSAVINQFVKLINLPINGLEPEGLAVLSGWGRIEFDGVTSPILKRVILPIVPISTCQFIYTVMHSHLCAGLNMGEKDGCQGDSGGPLVCFNKGPKRVKTAGLDLGLADVFGTDLFLCGIMSYGIGCGSPGFPGVYTRVGFYLDWIKGHITRHHRFSDDPTLEHRRSQEIDRSFYSSIGLVSNDTISKNKETCAAVLIHSRYMLTAAHCCPIRCGEIRSCSCTKIEFNMNEVPKSPVFKVAKQFSFDPQNAFNAFSRRSKSSLHSSRQKSTSHQDEPIAVLQLARGIRWPDSRTPLALPKTKHFLGLRATLVTMKNRRSDDGLTLITGQFQTVECPQSLTQSNMFRLVQDESSLCALHISGAHCEDAVLGSPLICKQQGRTEESSSTTDEFICGMVTNFDQKSRNPFKNGYHIKGLATSWYSSSEDICVFQKVLIPEFKSPKQGISLYDMMAFDGIEM